MLLFGTEPEVSVLEKKIRAVTFFGQRVFPGHMKDLYILYPDRWPQCP